MAEALDGPPTPHQPPPASRRGSDLAGDSASPLPPAGGAGGGQGTFRKRNTIRARALRNNASPPERLLWRRLRSRQLGGHKFSRQIPVGPFFADFLCREAKLIVELDGSSHDARQDHDAARDADLAARGFTVLRFRNADIAGNIEGVLRAILDALAPGPGPTPSPSRKREGRGMPIVE